MVPKIADFGLSRLIGEERTTQTMNKSIGTSGYLAPEYIKFQLLSPAFDIFSLGVIITKIMVGRQHYHDIADMPSRKFVRHVHTNWKKRLHREIVGPRSLLEVYCQQVKVCIEIASKCLMEDRQQRPTIQAILATLNETDEMIQSISSKIQEFQGGESTRASKGRITPVSTSERDSEASKSSYTENRSDRPTVTPMKIPHKLLENITDGFSVERVIGSGGYGVVYKGVYEDGQVIAVKKLPHYPGFDEHGFQRELENLVKACHENIIKLVGYSEEEVTNCVKYKGKLVFAVMKNMALCFEYCQNGSLESYISDEDRGLDWCACYKIIKGTCDGLRHLHEGLPSTILHMDLQPKNILLDENMTPKIGGFSTARLLIADGGSTSNTIRPVGRLGYLPPEYIEKGVISIKHDIFSLGVIFIKMIAGRNGYLLLSDCESKAFIEHVLGRWRKRLHDTCKGRSVDGYCRQVKRCIEIALRCVERDRHKRPNIGDIVRALEETETWIHANTELLDVHPMELRFPFKPKKHGSCLLQLHNKQDDHVAFRIMSESPAKYLSKLPLCSIVPPGCTYTLTLTTCKQPQQPPSDSDADECFILQSIPISHRSYLDQASAIRECESRFTKIQETAEDEMQEVTLKSLCAPQQDEEASSKLTRPEIEIITTPDARHVSSIEVHPTKPWIMTTHQGGNLRLWNYQTMAILNPIKVPDESVYVAKFIAREEWIVAGDDNGFIHVCSYDESQDETSFQAHDGQIMSLAVHPTDRHVLSSSHKDHLIKLWHWDQHWDFDKGAWECTRIFEGHCDRVSQVVFNQEDTDSFASASYDGTVKIWGLNPDMCNTITLDKHLDGLLCVDYITGADRQYLISGSKDGTLQIWDLETKRCREHRQGHACHISVVSCHPELQKLITGSLDGTVRIWDATKFRLENIIAFNLGAVSDVGYIDKLQRIVVGCQKGIAMMEIKFHEHAIARANPVVDWEGPEPPLPPPLSTSVFKEEEEIMESKKRKREVKEKEERSL